MQTQPTQSRISWSDMAKGYGTILVIYAHLGVGTLLWNVVNYNLSYTMADVIAQLKFLVYQQRQWALWFMAYLFFLNILFYLAVKIYRKN